MIDLIGWFIDAMVKRSFYYLIAIVLLYVLPYAKHMRNTHRGWQLHMVAIALKMTDISWSYAKKINEINNNFISATSPHEVIYLWFRSY